jgi:hypothetical protein
MESTDTKLLTQTSTESQWVDWHLLENIKGHLNHNEYHPKLITRYIFESAIGSGKSQAVRKFVSESTWNDIYNYIIIVPTTNIANEY